VDPKSRTRRKRTPPEEPPPNLVWGSLGFVVLKPPNESPRPWDTHYQYSGGGISYNQIIKNEKCKITEERFETKTFQKKTYFFQESQPRKKERKKEKNLPDTVF